MLNKVNYLDIYLHAENMLEGIVGLRVELSTCECPRMLTTNLNEYNFSLYGFTLFE